MPAGSITKKLLHFLGGKASPSSLTQLLSRQISRFTLSPTIRDIKSILTDKIVTNRLKREFAFPDTLYPGESWALERIKTIVFGWSNKEFHGSSGYYMLLTYPEKGKSRIYFAPEDDNLRFEGEQIFLMRARRPAPYYLVEIKGEPAAPKSLERDFEIIIKGQRISLPDFIDKHFPLTAGYMRTNRFALENNGLISRHKTTGIVRIMPRGIKFTGVETNGLQFRAGVAEFPKKTLEESEINNCQDHMPVLAYHFHPIDVPPVISAGDIEGMQKNYLKVGVQALVPEMVLNYAGEGTLYIPRHSTPYWPAAFAELASCASKLGPDPPGLLYPSRVWEKSIKKHFRVYRVRFSANGQMNSLVEDKSPY